jgi:hypothetical protein
LTKSAASRMLDYILNCPVNNKTSSLAQLAERKTVNLEAVSSILTGRAFCFLKVALKCVRINWRVATTFAFRMGTLYLVLLLP